MHSLSSQQAYLQWEKSGGEFNEGKTDYCLAENPWTLIIPSLRGPIESLTRS